MSGLRVTNWLIDKPIPCLRSARKWGGYTGGNMDRPVLQRLIGDINRRAIDCVVVYMWIFGKQAQPFVPLLFLIEDGQRLAPGCLPGCR